MKDQVRFGVIGAGWFASRRHLPEIKANPNVHLAGICRRDKAALARLESVFYPEQIYEDWRMMLTNCPMDAVLIATPNNQHYEQASAALDRGLHVLLEKPMTIHANEAHALMKKAMEKGLLLSVAFNPPFFAHTGKVREAILKDKIGRLEAIDMFWTGTASYAFGDAPKPPNLPGVVPPTLFRADPAQCGGGYFMDGGAHLVSEILWVSGMKVLEVSCFMDSLPSDRRATVNMKMENGVTATITCIGDSKLMDRRVRNIFAGSSGTIFVEGFDFETRMEIPGADIIQFREKELPELPGPSANFVEAILGRAELLSPPAHGVHVTEVIDAAYTSASSRKAIEIPLSE